MQALFFTEKQKLPSHSCITRIHLQSQYGQQASSVPEGVGKWTIKSRMESWMLILAVQGCKGWLTSKHREPAWSQWHNTHLWDLVIKLMQWVRAQALACTEVIHTSVQLGSNCKSKLFPWQTLTIITRNCFFSPRAIHKWNWGQLKGPGATRFMPLPLTRRLQMRNGTAGS